MNIETIVVIVFLGSVYLLVSALDLAHISFCTWYERRERRKRVATFYDKALLERFKKVGALGKFGSTRAMHVPRCPGKRKVSWRRYQVFNPEPLRFRENGRTIEMINLSNTLQAAIDESEKIIKGI